MRSWASHEMYPGWASRINACHSPGGRRLALVAFGDAIEVAQQFSAGLIAIRGIRLQTPGHDDVEHLRDGRVERAHGRRGFMHPGHQLRERRGGPGVPAAKEHVPQDQAERVNVGPLIDRFPFRLLGRHVRHRPDDGARDGHGETGRHGGRARDAEVHDQRVVLRVDHDVGRFQIAVHDAGLVRGNQPRDHLPGD